MIKILITGGTGFLGKNIQKVFYPLRDKYQTYFIGSHYNGVRYNLERQYDCERIFSLTKPDIVIHAAAKCGGIGLNKKQPADLMLSNMQMNCNVFEQSLIHKVDRIYSLGSVCGYGKYCPTPFKEDDLWNGFPEETNAGYGIAKKAMMLLFQSMRQQYGMKGAHLIPVNMYGLYDNFDLENSHVIPALIKKFVDAAKNNTEQVYCWGTGNATREFLYAEDCATALLKAVEQNLDTDLPINIGTGKEISIKNLADLIAKLTGFNGQIIFNGQVSDGQPRRMLDVSRAKEILNFEAKTQLEEGLLETINWFKNEYGE